MKKFYFNFYFTLAIFIYFFTPSIHASSFEKLFPLNARLIGEAGVANDLEVVNADVMLPLYGDDHRLWYINGLGRCGTHSSWLGSAGIGLRNITLNNVLLGVYLFGDWNRVQDAYFFVFNPGFEFMHQRWDVHVNAYIPTQNTKLIRHLIASHVGIKKYLYFRQHSEFDNLLALYDIIGNGLDMIFGYSIPHRHNPVRIFGGIYFYKPVSVSHISGLQGGIKFPYNQYVNIVLQDSYDSVFHNTAALSVEFTLGGVRQTEALALPERMLDPIPRHLGTLNTGSGVLDQKKLKNTGQSIVIDNNLWFFQPGTSLDQAITQDSCTFEHPCIGLTQTTINGINSISSNAKLYLAPGQYNNVNVGNGFNLNVGQSIIGRTQNYLQLAPSNNLPLINDTLFLNGYNLVSNLQINGQSDGGVFDSVNPTRGGIIINVSAIGPIQIYNSYITAISTDPLHDAVAVLNSSLNESVLMSNSIASASVSGALSSSVSVANRSHFIISNSILSANATTSLTAGFGAFNEDFGILEIRNSNINVNSPFFAAGVFNEDFGLTRIIKSNILANSAFFADGIANEDFGTVNVVKSNTTANAFIFAKGVSNEDFGLVHIARSNITANSNILAEGISNEDFGHISILNSHVTANSINFARGIFNEDFGLINVAKNSVIAANSPVSAIGVFNQDFGIIHFSNSSIIVNSKS